MATLAKALQKLNTELLRFRSVQILTPLIMREGAELARDLVADRIQQSGVNTVGQTMESGSMGRYGAYSRQWGLRRTNTGLQVGRIDFTFTGELMRDWAVRLAPGGKLTIGFSGTESAEKVDDLEKNFGEAFGMNAVERTRVNEKIKSRHNEILLR